MRRAILLLLLLAGSVRGQFPRDEEEKKIAEIVRPFVDEGWIRCAVVGLIDRNGPRVYGFGKIGDAPDAKTADGSTIFEIGSITKTFTGLLLAHLSNRQQLALDDPVSKFLPDTVKLPETDQPITLLRLATHHSGLPRMPSNFAPRDPANPYLDYDAAPMYEALAVAKVHSTDQYEYSNLAYGLLGHAMERRLDLRYETFLQRRILRHLGMNSTLVTLGEAEKARLAPPFDADLFPSRTWEFQAMAGAGAIRSTADDMLKYLGAQAGLHDTLPNDLGQAIAMSHQPRDSGPGEMKMGLGWHITKDGKLFHNGQTGGYHAFAMVDPAAKRGVVVLCNTATMRVDAIGGRAMRVLAGLATQPVQLPKAIALEAAGLEALAGRYILPDTTPLTVRREEGHLLTMSPCSGAVRIYPQSGSEFFARSTESTAVFERDSNGKVVAATVKRDGKELRAARSR